MSGASESPLLSRLRSLLAAADVGYAIHVHEHNLHTAEDGPEAGLGTLAQMAPTFILRTEAGHLAAIVRGDTRLSYKKIKRRLGLKDVSLASPGEVERLTGSEVGHVALVNPGIRTIVDERVLQVATIFGGSGERNHTLEIAPASVVALTGADVFDLADPKDEPR